MALRQRPGGIGDLFGPRGPDRDSIGTHNGDHTPGRYSEVDRRPGGQVSVRVIVSSPTPEELRSYRSTAPAQSSGVKTVPGATPE